MAIHELRQQHKLAHLLGCAKLARATYYHHVKQMTKPSKDIGLIDAIKTIYHKHKGRYGYRRMILALNKLGLGFSINHKRVQRLMHEMDLKAVIRKKSKYNSYRGEVGKICANHLNQEFMTNKPNHKWATDVTEFKVMDKQGNQNKLYLPPIIDLYNGEIVSYATSTNPNAKLIDEMLKTAFAKLNRNTDSG